MLPAKFGLASANSQVDSTHSHNIVLIMAIPHLGIRSFDLTGERLFLESGDGLRRALESKDDIEE